MPILNYTTTIEVDKTMGEIRSILVRGKARRIMTEYDDRGHAAALEFVMDTPAGEVCYRLPVDPAAALACLKREAQPRYQNMDQAQRVAWRILKDWVEAQVAMVQLGEAKMHEVMLPWMLLDQTDEQGRRLTVARVFTEQKMLALPAPAD